MENKMENETQKKKKKTRKRCVFDYVVSRKTPKNIHI